MLPLEAVGPEVLVGIADKIIVGHDAAVTLKEFEPVQPLTSFAKMV